MFGHGTSLMRLTRTKDISREGLRRIPAVELQVPQLHEDRWVTITRGGPANARADEVIRTDVRRRTSMVSVAVREPHDEKCCPVTHDS